MGFFDRLKAGLAKTKNAIFGKLDQLFKGFSKVDEEMLEELEEVLITADVGVTSTEIGAERDSDGDDRRRRAAEA